MEAIQYMLPCRRAIRICKIGGGSKYVNNSKIGIHLTVFIRQTGITICETQYVNREFQITSIKIQLLPLNPLSNLG